MKKKILVLVLCLALALTVLCACNPSGEKIGAPLSKANDVYGMGAISTVKLLGSNTSVLALKNLSEISGMAKNAPSPETQTQDEVKSQAQKFNEYFTALDSFLNEEIVTTVSEKNVDTKYPYETKLTINSRNFDGETVQNVMYFTETLLGTTTEENETETKYSLEGIMVVDGNDYLLEGARSIEQEDGETENELKIRAYADISDKTSYVEMEQEHSAETDETETEYVYSIYSNGVLVEQTAVEFETENNGNKEEVEYELEFRKGAARGKYVVERETENGKVRIKVRYNIDGKQGAFRISVTTDANGEKHYEYSFDDNTKLVF